MMIYPDERPDNADWTKFRGGALRVVVSPPAPDRTLRVFPTSGRGAFYDVEPGGSLFGVSYKALRRVAGSGAVRLADLS